MAPSNFVMLRIGADFAFEVHIVALLYVLRIQSAAQMQLYLRRDWKERKRIFWFSQCSTCATDIMKYFGENGRGISKSLEYVNERVFINKTCGYSCATDLPIQEMFMSPHFK